MTKLFYIFVVASVFMVACNKASNNTAAAPPAPTNQCISPTNTAYNSYGGYNGYYSPYYNNGLNVGTSTCNPQLYNQYNQYGFTAYPYTNFYNYNWGNNYAYMPLCDCPVNTRPVYNGTMGLGCVSIQYFNPISVGAYYWSLTPNNYQWVNWTQVSNISGNVGNMTNCYQQVASACFIDTPNSCGAGFVCQATSGGSRLGICRQQ